MHMGYLYIFANAASLTMGSLYDCTSASGLILNDVDNSTH